MNLLLLAFAVGLPAHADTVYLKNGNQMDGVITEQTKVRITLDIGYGSTILDRADIEKIVRADKGQASKTAAEKAQGGVFVRVRLNGKVNARRPRSRASTACSA